MSADIHRLPPLSGGRKAPTINLDRDAVGGLVDAAIRLRRIQRAYDKQSVELAGALDALEQTRLGARAELTPRQQLAVLRLLRECERAMERRS